MRTGGVQAEEFAFRILVYRDVLMIEIYRVPGIVRHIRDRIGPGYFKPVGNQGIDDVRIFFYERSKTRDGF